MSLSDIDNNSMSDRKRPTTRPPADNGRMETYGKAHRSDLYPRRFSSRCTVGAGAEGRPACDASSPGEWCGARAIRRGRGRETDALENSWVNGGCRDCRTR